MAQYAAIAAGQYQLSLDGRSFSCAIKYSSRRRSLGLKVDHRGLQLNLPTSGPFYAEVADVEQAIQPFTAWIFDNLGKYTAAVVTPFTLESGAQIPILGQTCSLDLLQGQNRVVWSAADAKLTLLVKPGTNAQDLLIAALKRRVRSIFRDKLSSFGRAMGIERPLELKLSSAHTRWGSCSYRGSINLNWKLIYFEPAIIDYVVVHELAHLFEMNHSQRFWAIVEQHFPDWRQARQRLNETAAELARRGII